MTPRKKFEALRDECERRAREAEQRVVNPQLSQEQRWAASDEAKALWQLSRDWADMVARDADARPAKFTGKNRGRQAKTLSRIEFIEEIRQSTGASTHEAIAATAIEKHHVRRVRALWGTSGETARSKILNFLKNNRL